MSEFEYLRNIPFGQVVPGDSPVHRLDPRARITLFTFLLSAVLFTPRPLGLLLGLAALLVGVRLARLPLGYTLRALRAPLPFILFLAVLQVFFNGTPDSGPVLLNLNIILITSSDVLTGVMLLLRFATMVIGITFAGQVLSTSELAHGIESMLSPLERAGLPVHDGVMVLLVTVRFLPFLAQSAERIAKAQASRGARWTRVGGGLLQRARATLPLLVPIFVTSLRRADVMALAMDARGYASRAHPTSLIEMRFTPRDALAIAISITLAALILFV
jgi:energy-coupling factor transport system permease protein